MAEMDNAFSLENGRSLSRNRVGLLNRRSPYTRHSSPYTRHSVSLLGILLSCVVAQPLRAQPATSPKETSSPTSSKETPAESSRPQKANPKPSSGSANSTLRGRDLKTGSDFFSALTQQRGVEWKGLPLHIATEQLSADLKLAIFLDRRVDPNTRIDVSADKAPVYQLLDELAESAKVEIAVIEFVVYLAPIGAGDQIGARAQRVAEQRFPVAWTGRRTLDWPRLSSPREQLEKMFALRRLRLGNAESIPHDLWRATHLPAMSLPLQSQIIAAGFDLDLKVNRNEGRFEPITTVEPRYSDRYAVPKTHDWDTDRVVKILGDNVRIDAGVKAVTLVGTSWQHAKLAAILRQRPTKPISPNAPGTVVQYTVPKTSGPLAKIIPALAKRLMLEVQLSDKIELKDLDQVVEFSVTNATRKQLLDAIFADTKLANRVVKGKWIIEPR
jgi:hypothetical protein